VLLHAYIALLRFIFSSAYQPGNEGQLLKNPPAISMNSRAASLGTKSIVKQIVDAQCTNDELISLCTVSGPLIHEPESLYRCSLRMLRRQNAPTRSPAFELTETLGTLRSWTYNEIWSPLAAACLTGRLPVVRRLLELGASPWAAGSAPNQLTPLHIALWGGNADIFDALCNVPAADEYLASHSRSLMDFALRLPSAPDAVAQVLGRLQKPHKAAQDCIRQFNALSTVRFVYRTEPALLPAVFRVLSTAALSGAAGAAMQELRAAIEAARMQLHTSLLQVCAPVPDSVFDCFMSGMAALDSRPLLRLSVNPPRLAAALASLPFTGNAESVLIRLRIEQFDDLPTAEDAWTQWTEAVPPPQWQAAMLCDGFPYLHTSADADDDDDDDDDGGENDGKNAGRKWDDGKLAPRASVRRTAAALGTPAAATHFYVPSRAMPQWNMQHTAHWPGGVFSAPHAPTITMQQRQQQAAASACVLLCFFDPLVRHLSGRLGLQPHLTPACANSCIRQWTDGGHLFPNATAPEHEQVAAEAAQCRWNTRMALGGGGWQPLSSGTAEGVLFMLTCAQLDMSSGYLPRAIGAWSPAVAAVCVALLQAHPKRLASAVSASMCRGATEEPAVNSEAGAAVGRVPRGWLPLFLGALKAWRGGQWGARQRMVLARARRRKQP